MHIPQWPQAGEREAELLRLVLESPQWGGFHPFVAEFEESFAAYQHSSFGIGASNGTVTLEAVLQIAGVAAGDEVIVPAISFISTASAVSRLGAVPVFVDIEADSFNIDPERVRQAITPLTKAVIAVHFGGVMCRIADLQHMCQEHNLILIEDAAHAQGSEWCGKRAGSFGLAGSFSFQNGKVLSAGEGGLLVTSDPNLAERLRAFTNCGRMEGRPFYEHHTLGTNLRMTGFQAAVLLAQLERLPQQIALRSSNAQLLMQSLSDLPTLAWQNIPAECTQNSYYLLPASVKSAHDRDQVIEVLSNAGVPCAPFYPHTLYQNALYETAACRVTPCPVAESFVQCAFWLPHRVLLAEKKVMRQVAELIRGALTGTRTTAIANLN
jgi:dTDP-4-amino-4,6-dideoxygalactose transaminase